MRLFITVCLGFLLSLLTSFAWAKTSVVIVQGLAGEDYYQRHFDEQAAKISEASTKFVGEKSVYIFPDDANKETILPELSDVISAASKDDLLIVYLVGHGSFDGRDYKFNISGVDISGGELLELLAKSSASIVLVNTSSSSGALLKSFKEASDTSNIHLVTATKSGAERTATRFGRHLADGLLSSAADINKNQSISLQEAFDYAVEGTQGFYDEEGLLATENARLQMGSAEVDPKQIRLTSLVERPNSSLSNELTALYQQRDELDRQIDTLRLRRINMTEQAYLEQFQGLMVELAILQTQIDEEVDTQ